MAQYSKPDSELGFVGDTALIEKLKFDNLRHTVLGCMLGDFNEVGDYVVSPEIVKELISMEKYVDRTYENVELCKSFLKLDKQISFLITFEGNKATLSLIEKLNYEGNFALNSGTYSNINEYVLDTVETTGDINRNMIYIRWNIRVANGNVVDIFNCDSAILEKYLGIVNRFKYILETNKIILKSEAKMEEIEAGYANDIFAILDRYPTLKDAVLANVKKSLTEKKNSINIKKPFFANTFNEMLENSVNQNLSVLSEKELEEFNVEKRNAIVNLNLNRQGILETEHYNIEEGSKSPNGIRLKTDPNYSFKTLEELGGELVDANIDAINHKDSGELGLIQRTILAIGERKGTNPILDGVIASTERNRLNERLTGLGLGEFVGIEKPQQEKDVSKDVQKQADQNKAQAVKKQQANNNDKKQAASAKKGGGSGGGKKGGGSNGKSNKTDKNKSGGKDSSKTKTESQWVFLRTGSGNSDNLEVKKDQPKVEDKFNPDLNRKKETIMTTRDRLETTRRQIETRGRTVETIHKRIIVQEDLESGL